MRLTLEMALPAVTASAAERTLRGVALPYGIEGSTSAGRLTVDAGAVRIPADLKRCKLFRDHGRQNPVGYALAAEDSSACLTMAFRAGETPDGDRAILEAAQGIRDSLSVELDDLVIRAGHVISAVLTAVALVPIPAFTGADLVAADTPERPAMTAPAAPAPPPPPPPPPPGAPPAPPAPAAPPPPSAPPVPPQPNPDIPPVPANLNAAQRGGAMTGAPRVPSFAAAVERVRNALNGSTDASAVNAALSDVVPANDAGKGFLRDQWLGEIWTPQAAMRRYIPAIGSAPLTGMRVYGWKWTTLPQVGPYAGNKAPIPSNPVKIDPAEANAYRLAGGWDVDRIMVDLAAPGFLEAMFQAAAVDCANKSEAHVAATLLAGATSIGDHDTLTDAIAAIGGALSPYGLTPSFISMSSDIWADYLSLTTADVPWWLAKGSTVDLTTGDSDLNGQSIFCDPTLPAATVLAGARQAATYYQSPGGSPLRVQAVNIPNGGIDIAVFLYAAEMINDGRGVVVAKITGAAPPLARSGAKTAAR